MSNHPLQLTPFHSHGPVTGQTADELLRRRMASPRSKSLMVTSKGEAILLEKVSSSHTAAQNRSLAAAAAVAEQKLLQTRLSGDAEFQLSPMGNQGASRRSMGYRPKGGQNPYENISGKPLFYQQKY